MPGDRENLLSSYPEWRERIARFLTRRLGNQDVAAELTQEVWLRISTGAVPAAIDNRSSFLFRVAANLATDYERAERRRLLTPYDIEVILSVPDVAPSPEDAAIARDDLIALERALAELPERRRNIFLLNRVHGVRQRDIAEKYGVNIRTIENEIMRALSHCAKRLRKR